MREKIHLVICGERGVGKSTCIRRVIRETKPEISGFITKSESGTEDGFHDIYIHAAGQSENERHFGKDNLIGSCNKVIHRINTEVFETKGVEYLTGCRGDIIVMDELGFMEADASAFQQAVIDCLEGDVPVIAAIKPRVDVCFLNRIRCMDKVEVIPIYERTREDVYLYVRDRLKEILELRCLS